MINQLSIPQIQEDIMASSLRHHNMLFKVLINDLEQRELPVNAASERIRLLERGLRRLISQD